MHGDTICTDKHVKKNPPSNISKWTGCIQGRIVSSVFITAATRRKIPSQLPSCHSPARPQGIHWRLIYLNPPSTLSTPLNSTNKSLLCRVICFLVWKAPVSAIFFACGLGRGYVLRDNNAAADKIGWDYYHGSHVFRSLHLYLRVFVCVRTFVPNCRHVLKWTRMPALPIWSKKKEKRKVVGCVN